MQVRVPAIADLQDIAAVADVHVRVVDAARRAKRVAKKGVFRALETVAELASATLQHLALSHLWKEKCDSVAAREGTTRKVASFEKREELSLL